MADVGRLRIGELSRRAGVSPELLRAWERRYGLLHPERSSGGLRLYSPDDERRVRTMCDQIAAGLSAAEAARVALRPPGSRVELEPMLVQLDRALTALDEPAAQAALDQIFGTLGLELAVERVILPFLRELGERWARAERSVGQEHFASNVIGGRLRALARGWGDGDGRRALLACPPGEQHELGLICFGLLLRDRGWAITYLGAETPTADLATSVAELKPDIVVLGSMGAQRFLDAADGIRGVGEQARLVIGGQGASEDLARSLGGEFADDLVAMARAVDGASS